MVLRSEWLWGAVGELTNNNYFCRPILDFVTLSVLSLQESMRKSGRDNSFIISTINVGIIPITDLCENYYSK